MPSQENVVVAVRCRPLNSKEINELNIENVVRITENHSVELLKSAKHEAKQFAFDLAFDDNSTQENVYESTARGIVDAALEGFNGTIFAYGQTGTGKTFTMQGSPDAPGIIPNSFIHIFNKISNATNKQFLVRASFMEIYNEEIRDLLVNSSKQRPLELKEHPENGVYVKDLSSFIVKNVKELERLMDFGNKNRSVAATLMNETSSRSHSIFTVTIESSHTATDANSSDSNHYRVGKLNLVDLAGSERQSKTGATGDRLKEATKINLSLSALGNCISALVDGKSAHIPYRDSKLTRLLQDSLGGNSKTLMIATLSPAASNQEETLSTLRYANRAKNIKNKPKINEDPKDALLREYQDEIKKLQMEIEKRKGTNAINDSGPLESLKAFNRTHSIHEIGSLSSLDSAKSSSGDDLMRIQQSLIQEKEALLESKNLLAEEKQRMSKELQIRIAELEVERQESEALASKLKQLESKLLIGGGKNFAEHVSEQEQVLRQTEQTMEEHKIKEKDLELKLQEKQELQFKLEENYHSLQEEIESKGKKIQKLWQKLEIERAEIQDLQDEFREEREAMLDSIRELSRVLSLKVSIIESFIPIDDRLKIERRAKYNEDLDNWTLSKHIPVSERTVKRSISSKQTRIPICLFAKKFNRSVDGDLRYKKEHILTPELDMPERTTFDVGEYELMTPSFSLQGASSTTYSEVLDVQVSGFSKKKLA